MREALFQEVCLDDEIRVKLRDWPHDDFQKASAEAAKGLEDLIKDELERHLYTLHPRLITVRTDRQRNRINEMTRI